MPVLEEEPAQKESSRPKHPDLLVDLDEHAQAGTKTPLFHRRGVIIGGAALALLAIVYVATIFFHSLTHESTDDAFIDAHIVSIAPKIAGRISAVKVRDNQLVKQGDLLIEIDPHDIEASVPQKQAALDVAKAHFENAQLSAEQASAHVATVRAAFASVEATTNAAAADTKKLRGDLARNKGLIASGAISKQDFQHSLSDVSSSEANLDAKRKQLQAAAALAEEAKKQAGSAKAQASAARAEVAEAQAELHEADLQKSYTAVTAAEADRVTNKSVEPGTYVQIGQPPVCDCADAGLGDGEFQGNVAQ